MEQNGGQRTVIVKNWQVVLFVLVWGGTFVWNYSGLSTRAAELERRVSEVESHSVTKEQFNEFRDDLFRRLTDWENQREIRNNLRP